MSSLYFPEGTRIALAGPIGAGKTTIGYQLEQLLFEAGKDSVFFEEELPIYIENILRDSNAEPQRHMELFQTLMLMRAVVRSTAVFHQSPDFVVINERSVEESWIFGNANLKLGRISQQYYDDVYRPIHAEYDSMPNQFIVFFYVSEETAAMRRTKRNRPGEDNYGEAYLTALADEYFDWVIGHCAKGDILVVDWNTPVPPQSLLQQISNAMQNRKSLIVPCAPKDDIADPLERRRYQETRLAEIARLHFQVSR